MCLFGKSREGDLGERQLLSDRGLGLAYSREEVPSAFILVLFCSSSFIFQYISDLKSN